jgi:hypothetical protein
MRKLHLLIIFSLCTIWYSCAISDAVVLQPNAKYEKVKANEVVLYLNVEDLPTNYEKIGVIFNGGVSLPSRQIQKARRDAAAMGADGLYWENFNGNQRSYNIVGDTIVVGQQQNNGYLIAIRKK